MYHVITYPEASDQIAALPVHLLPDYAQALDALASTPWQGMSHNSNNSDAEVRRWLFGPLGVGQVIYLVLEREHEVHVLRVVWLELPGD
ncbi:hypothetical protein [Pseudonocardia spinosispora]|uniref:hypothetical protein n=1 Tax=Pseudonocardia spinosispora TaxID=103441 RepID=UPI00040DED4D|nr:hypothetical protein [Pseudonocardia spinosispora]